jgi:site-specific DNA-methyltransferase (adenine-specific)
MKYKTSKKKHKVPDSELTLYSRYVDPNANGEIFQGDALAFLSNLQDDVASIVFLDPPFNLGKDYGNGKGHDRRPHTQYISWLLAIIRESERVLMPGGALYVYHLPSLATQLTGLLNEIFQFRHWIAISMKNTFVRGNWLYPAHYALLYYTKGSPAHFYRPKLTPQKCRHCNSYIKDYGGYRHIIEKKGINLSDIWESGVPEDLYVDPFAGGGNGVLAALKVGMRFSTCDIEEEYCRLVSERIEEAIRENGGS